MGTTPVRRQYLSIKRQYPDVLVFFRLGDFYETFDEDAHIASRELGITLTSREMGRGKRYPMAGIPYHALDGYLARLVKRGYKVAICEQVGDPSLAKGLVERQVVRVVTPGTVVEPNLLEQKANNYLVALVPEGDEAGIAYVDISTGEFRVAQVASEEVASELERVSPSELLLPQGLEPPESWAAAPVTPMHGVAADLQEARRLLLDHFQAASLEPFGCEGLPLAIRAAAGVLEYLIATQKSALGLLNRISTYSLNAYMTVDPQTRRNLELFRNAWSGEVESSLLSVIDLTRTPMGGRLLKRWLGQPLLDIKELERRQDAVEAFHTDSITRARTIKLLGQVGDLERMIVRVQRGIANPKELIALKKGLGLGPELRELLDRVGKDTISWLVESIPDCGEVAGLIARVLVDDPSTSVGEGGVVRPGFNDDLDQVRTASASARDYIAGLEKKERQRTGIRTLRVGYNKVFGYYVEVSKSNLSRVPDSYIRKQTLVNGERYVTEELKKYESLILDAQEKVEVLETSIFRQLCSQVAAGSEKVRSLAEAVARVDIFSSLAEVAALHGYVRPTLTEGDEIAISGGRHPVVERVVGEGRFVPNDTQMSNGSSQIVVLTGPNMSGKSTYLRQVALIVLLAQMGSFVPADSARIGLVDRIFTRVGLQDDLATGRSTFMVEMLETAGILHQATPRSLIVLDEIGRGTSTYDGLSIAQAVVEYIHNDSRVASKTIFATHYHELVELANVLPRIVNYNVAVAEEEGKAIFLYKVVPGGADKSYGIHVAQLAGLPRPVINRAREVLQQLEASSHRNSKGTAPGSAKAPPQEQLSMFQARPQALDELMEIDVSSMTPLEAITKLYELQQKAKDGAD
ncbi:MAG: DNA mismatch repair protein MutS [Chloroflexi bacterium]|nr:DNA mismatch repair protein MutS [Chloroflexota bacterium]